MPLTRPQARQAAKRLLARGYHHPEIIEDIETGEIRVQAHNRCWNLRTINSPSDLSELLFTERTRRESS